MGLFRWRLLRRTTACDGCDRQVVPALYAGVRAHSAGNEREHFRAADTSGKGARNCEWHLFRWENGGGEVAHLSRIGRIMDYAFGPGPIRDRHPARTYRSTRRNPLS